VSIGTNFPAVSRPAPVRITDLAAPGFPAATVPIREAMAEMGATVQLREDALLADAVAQTGLEDFGDDLDDGWWRTPFSLLVRIHRDAPQLSAAGRLATYAQFVGLLKNRLLLRDYLRRHPEAAAVAVTAPIIICGLPRTGTTHLHNLMGADPALRSLPYWEANEPVPLPGEQPDQRQARTAGGLQILNACVPYFVRMHEMTTDHVHEEIALLQMAFASQVFESLGFLAEYREWVVATDQTPAYEYMKRCLAVLAHQRGAGKRWVLKSPQHLEQFAVLRRVFPDATYVVTHRDPVAVCASLATMMSYLARLSIDHPDPVAIGGFWIDRIDTVLRRCVADRELLPPDQSIDVYFDEFMADDLAMVERIYGLAGQPFGAASRGAMATYLADHPRGRHGGVVYDLAGDFGVTAAALEERFAYYTDRFPAAVRSPNASG
jgi:hypothetical protein